MKFTQRPSVAAFGAATIIYLEWFAPLASNVHEKWFQTPGSVANVVVPLLIGFTCTWMFWWIALAVSRRYRLLRVIVWCALLVLLMRNLLEAWLALGPNTNIIAAPTFPSTQKNICFALAMVILIASILWMRLRNPKGVARAKVLATDILSFVAFSGLVTILQIAAFTWKARNLNTPQPLHAITNSTPKGHRIVWILMDELSYRQVYEHRFPDLQMPAFDRLASDSTVFTHVQPEGKLTLRIIPALLSGFPDNDIKMVAAGKPLYLRNAAHPQWRAFDPQQTVFQDALDAGYNTAAAGWVVPYCRLLSSVLDKCMWASSGEVVARLNTTQSIGWNLKRLFTQPLRDRLAMLRLVKHHGAEYIDTPAILYNRLLDTAKSDIEDPRLSFIYVHIDSPHPYGMFNRHTGKFDMNNTTYIDNLALCDRFLADIRASMESTGSWDNTDLVIMGDHSWRVYGWSKDPHWTAEEQKASDNATFDDRPAYIVHLAGQTAPTRIDSPYKAARTRALMDELIQNRITTPQQLADWVK